MTTDPTTETGQGVPYVRVPPAEITFAEVDSEDASELLNLPRVCNRILSSAAHSVETGDDHDRAMGAATWFAWQSFKCAANRRTLFGGRGSKCEGTVKVQREGV